MPPLPRVWPRTSRTQVTATRGVGAAGAKVRWRLTPAFQAGFGQVVLKRGLRHRRGGTPALRPWLHTHSATSEPPLYGASDGLEPPSTPSLHTAAVRWGRLGQRGLVGRSGLAARHASDVGTSVAGVDDSVECVQQDGGSLSTLAGTASAVVRGVSGSPLEAARATSGIAHIARRPHLPPPPLSAQDRGLLEQWQALVQQAASHQRGSCRT